MILASRQLVRLTVAARRLLKEIPHPITSDLDPITTSSCVIMSHPYEVLDDNSSERPNDFIVTACEHETPCSLNIARDSSDEFDSLQQRVGGLEVDAQCLRK